MRGGSAFEFQDWLSGAANKIKGSATSAVGASDESKQRFITILLCIAMLVALAALIGWATKKFALLETPRNIRNRLSSLREDATKTDIFSAINVGRRQGLRKYLNSLMSNKIPASHIALTNFYVSTVNAAGLFFPAKDGIVSPDAIRLAANAGARCFVFDIWPDLRPGGNFAPILQAVEDGSQWRRVSMNLFSFQTIFNQLIETVYRGGQNPNGTFGSEDFMIVYLRFRGVPRSQTYDACATIIRAAAEQYRLDTSFNACRGQDRVFKMPVTELFQKIIFISNQTARGTLLEDYINVGPRTGVRLEWSPADIRALDPSMQTNLIPTVKQNLTFSMVPVEVEKSEKNDWEWKESQNLGIHFQAMNFFNSNDKLREYMNADNFGVFSYKLKPERLRYIIELLPKPQTPPDFGYGQGQDAGKLAPVEGIQTV